MFPAMALVMYLRPAEYAPAPNDSSLSRGCRGKARMQPATGCPADQPHSPTAATPGPHQSWASCWSQQAWHTYLSIAAALSAGPAPLSFALLTVNEDVQRTRSSERGPQLVRRCQRRIGSHRCCCRPRPPLLADRTTVKARGGFPTEHAALKCLYLLTQSLDPTGKGQARWTMRSKPALNACAITLADRWSTLETY